MKYTQAIHQETLEAEGSFYIHLVETHQTKFITIDLHVWHFKMAESACIAGVILCMFLHHSFLS